MFHTVSNNLFRRVLKRQMMMLNNPLILDLVEKKVPIKKKEEPIMKRRISWKMPKEERIFKSSWANK